MLMVSPTSEKRISYLTYTMTTIKLPTAAHEKGDEHNQRMVEIIWDHFSLWRGAKAICNPNENLR